MPLPRTTVVRSGSSVVTRTVHRSGLVTTMVGERSYLVVANNQVVRSANGACALEAREVLKPAPGEQLFVRVGE